ncbi:hypothetical protein K491DRAFT_682715 [Lophiostoma macrostomum CBS 122681]|uniref:F-box domain-containing protein n=1 Tax=Lophiostoma macrostomum CBS 122681 TaxID=1314788 RepID=A0A6A6ST25_9PLEO|nr:hypothetical protein K491DRAFT_682715 [Lophiostoma macrostomum CBS 122681]
MADQPFRFLDLPPELRLMVYERLPRKIKHRRITEKTNNDYVILIDKSIPTSILATCKQIYDEAIHIVSEAIRDFILYSPPKLICSFPSDDSHKKFFKRLLDAIVQCKRPLGWFPYASVIDTLIPYDHLYETDTPGSTASKIILRWAKKAAAHQLPLSSPVTQRTVHVVGQDYYGLDKDLPVQGRAQFLRWLRKAGQSGMFRTFGDIACAGYQWGWTSGAGQEGWISGLGYREVTPKPINFHPTPFMFGIVEAEPKMNEEVWFEQWAD